MVFLRFQNSDNTFQVKLNSFNKMQKIFIYLLRKGMALKVRMIQFKLIQSQLKHIKQKQLEITTLIIKF